MFEKLSHDSHVLSRLFILSLKIIYISIIIQINNRVHLYLCFVTELDLAIIKQYCDIVKHLFTLIKLIVYYL